MLIYLVFCPFILFLFIKIILGYFWVENLHSSVPNNNKIVNRSNRWLGAEDITQAFLYQVKFISLLILAKVDSANFKIMPANLFT